MRLGVYVNILEKEQPTALPDEAEIQPWIWILGALSRVTLTQSLFDMHLLRIMMCHVHSDMHLLCTCYVQNLLSIRQLDRHTVSPASLAKVTRSTGEHIC